MPADRTAPRTEVEPLAFRDFQQLREFVRGFEAGTLPKSRWNHAAHLAVSMWYFGLLPAPEASARVADGIRAYNRAQGIRTTATSGYHETVTLFWLGVTHRFLSANQSTNLLDRVNAFVAAYANRGELIYRHYSREALRSWRARSTWIEPDLEPLDP